MEPEDTIAGMELPVDTQMVEFGFVTDSSHFDSDRRLFRIEALDASYEILEAREIKIPDGDD
jgi:hypothetical protein